VGFTPREPWPEGEHWLLASSILEDVAGNRIGRPFELAITSSGRVGGEPTSAALAFQVRAAAGP
jgi:hypothetical protein